MLQAIFKSEEIKPKGFTGIAWCELPKFEE